YHAPIHDVGGDVDSTTPRHRVACIDDQVQQSDLELIAIGANPRKCRGEVERELETSAERPLQHGFDSPDDLVKVERFKSEVLAAREGQQLLRQCRTPLARMRRIVGKRDKTPLIAELAS